MSLFNIIVPPHPLSPYLLRIINWAQPDDENKKYPLLGRMRYVWLSKDKKSIFLLLKDGPSSWSEEKEEILKQITTHENYKTHTIPTRDSVYIEAEFTIPTNIHCDVCSELMENIDMLDLELIDKGYASITDNPWDLFDSAMERLQSGDKNELEKVAPLMNSLKEQIENSDSTKVNIISVGISEEESKKIFDETQKLSEPIRKFKK
jgi:hypothetical protein